MHVFWAADSGCLQGSISETLHCATLLCVSIDCCFRILITRFLHEDKQWKVWHHRWNLAVRCSWVWSLCIAFSYLVKQSIVHLQITCLHGHAFTSVLYLTPPTASPAHSACVARCTQKHYPHVVWALSIWVFPSMRAGIAMNGRQEAVQGKVGGSEYLKQQFCICTVNCWWLLPTYLFFPFRKSWMLQSGDWYRICP